MKKMKMKKLFAVFIRGNPRKSVARIFYRTSKLTAAAANTFCPAAGI